MLREKIWQNSSPFNAPGVKAATIWELKAFLELVCPVTPQEATGTSSEALILGTSEIRRHLQGHVAVTGYDNITAPTAAGGRDSVSKFF